MTYICILIVWVVDPLNAWLLTDYVRINDQILKLHEHKRDMDKASERLGKSEVKKDDQLLAEQTSKEFERQMEIVKLELLKLTAIKNEHAGLFFIISSSAIKTITKQLPPLLSKLEPINGRSF